MNVLSIINKYYSKEDQLKDILLIHSRAVADKSLQIAENHPELHLDKSFLEEAAMLHDLGIFLTHAPRISCTGTYPYIAHGYLGADLLRKEGYERHALVCERHTGTGLTLATIKDNNLPIPHREMIPISLEEQVICFADKFYSKSHLDKEKSVEEAMKTLQKFGEEGILKFENWCEQFL